MNILYIYGWALTPELCPTLKYLRENLSNSVFSIEYDQYDPLHSVKHFEHYISSKCIDVVIASSYGAFIALNIRHPIKKFLINPCLRPSKEIPKLDENADNNSFIEKHRAMEEDLSTIAPEFTTAFFGANDELFSYKNEYIALGHSNFIELPNQQHRLNEDGLNILINEVKKSIK